MDYVASLSLWWLAVTVSVALIGIGLVGLVISRRWVGPWLQIQRNDAPYAATAIQSAMLIYSLIAALTMVSVWTKHSEAANVVSVEATAIASLWHDLGAYPAPVREQMRTTLREYTEQVINNAWPLQRQGKVPREGVTLMYKLQDQLFPFEPTSDAVRLAHAETLRSFNNLVQARRQRLDAVQARLPGLIWLVLIPGAVVCVALCLLFPVESVRLQAVLVTAIAGFIAMVLFVIIALDRPFQGGMAIEPESYELIYLHHMRR